MSILYPPPSPPSYASTTPTLVVVQHIRSYVCGGAGEGLQKVDLSEAVAQSGWFPRIRLSKSIYVS